MFVGSTSRSKNQLNPKAAEFVSSTSEVKARVEIKRSHPHFFQTNPEPHPAFPIPLQTTRMKDGQLRQCSLTLKRLLLAKGVDEVEVNTFTKGMKTLAAQGDNVYIKGCFAIYALAYSSDLIEQNPLRVKDLDLEILCEETRFKYCVSQDTQATVGEAEFYNIKRFLPLKEKSGLGSDHEYFPCDMTIAPIGYCVFDFFVWTCLKLKVGEDGVIYITDAYQMELFKKIQDEMRTGKFSISWNKFLDPGNENGLGRLVKYLYQFRWYGFELTPLISDRDLTYNIGEYLALSAPCSLYKDLGTLAAYFFNVTYYVQTSSSDYNEKWLAKLTDYIHLIILKMVSRTNSELTRDARCKLAKKIWNELKSEIETFAKTKLNCFEITFPLESLPPAFIEVAVGRLLKTSDEEKEESQSATTHTLTFAHSKTPA